MGGGSLSAGWNLWTDARVPSSTLWHSSLGPESRGISRELSSCFSRMFQIVPEFRYTRRELSEDWRGLYR